MHSVLPGLRGQLSVALGRLTAQLDGAFPLPGLTPVARPATPGTKDKRPGRLISNYLHQNPKICRRSAESI